MIVNTIIDYNYILSSNTIEDSNTFFSDTINLVTVEENTKDTNIIIVTESKQYYEKNRISNMRIIDFNKVFYKIGKLKVLFIIYFIQDEVNLLFSQLILIL